MKKNIFFYLFVLLIICNEYGAELTPQFAASAVATCSVAKSSTQLLKMHCLSSDSGQEALCFTSAEDQKSYKRAKEVHPAFFFLSYLFGRSAPNAPIASCKQIGSHEIPSELTCISTDLSNIDEKLCIVDGYDQVSHGYRVFVKEQIRINWDTFVSGLTRDSDDMRAGYKASIPLQGESLNNYVSRVLNSSEPVCLPFDKSHCMLNIFEKEGLLTQLPVHTQPYFIALAAELGALNLNAVIPSVGACPLDYAVLSENEELIFFLWDKGARLSKTFQPGRLLATSEKSLISHLFWILLEAEDKRSLSVLKNMVDEGLYCHPTIYMDARARAIGLNRELILEKRAILGYYDDTPLQACSIL